VASRLLIRLCDAAATRAQWLPIGDPAGVTGEGTLADAASAARGLQVTVLVPSSELLLTRIAVPSRKAHHVRMAVPYLLEDQVADDIGTLHFAVGPRAADGTVGVAVINRARLQDWLDDLAAAGIAVTAMIPDLLALPLQATDWLLAGDADALLLRCGASGGLVLDEADGPALLAAALTVADPPPARLHVIGAAAAAVITALPEAERPEVVASDTALLPLLAGGLDPANGTIDLLQGGFARDAGRRARLATWRRPLAFAACLLLLLLGARIVNVQRLDRESVTLDAALVSTFRQAFPDVTRVVDPVKQMQLRLARSTGGDENHFLDLLAAISTALARQEKWQVASLSYRDSTLPRSARWAASMARCAAA